MKFLIKILLISIAIAFLAGCSDKEPEANKPALYWYQKILNEINKYDLNRAGDAYSSLKSEHFMSPLLPEATLIMANAHIENEEYILANYYLDEYSKRYGNSGNVEFIKFLKLKANYNAFKHPNRDQKLLLDTIDKVKDYTYEMEESKFAPYANTMLATLKIANGNMNKEIAKLYKKKGKQEGYELYKERSEIVNEKGITIKEPDVFWLRKLVE
ncbi:MAG: outer membrane protein assembly factor BamD [Campylobacterales bacterium]|nr:outer membrane protein assembly factor BamD [Campylobacterales bacterium]